jgi:drug/metabolite transporter (DMT)-like permease
VAAVLALLASLLWGAGDFGGGLLSRRLPVVVVIALSQTTALVFVGIAFGIAEATGSVSWDVAPIVWGVASGVAGMVGLVSFYYGLSLGAMGVVAPIASLGLGVPVVVGLAGGDRPSALQIAGIAIAVVGVVLVARTPASATTGSDGGRAVAVHRRSVVCALLAAVGFGIGILAIAKGSGNSDASDRVLVTLLTQRLTDVGIAAVALLVLRQGFRAVRRCDLPPLAAVGFLDITANVALGLASQRGLVSVVSVLSSLYPVVTTLLARQFLHERLGRTQLVGVGVSLIGVIALGAG